MGWDMFVRDELLTPKVIADFQEASGRVIELAGSVDGLLSSGALDCSACARQMERMSAKSAWCDWAPEDFKEAVLAAVDVEPPECAEPPEENNLWAYWSAREFIRVCAKHGLAAEASY